MLTEQTLTSLVFVKEIFQKDRENFVIKWTDGCVMEYNLLQLQLNCPCAHCTENRQKPEHGARKPSTDNSLKARKISSVGSYALRIDFTSGCSFGIFSFDLLRELGLVHAE